MNASWFRAPSHDPPAIVERLQAEGFCILRNFADPARMARLSEELDGNFARMAFSDGLFFGRKTKRLQGLLKRTSGAAELVMDRTILDLADAVLLPNCDRIQLNLTQAIEIHPGELAQAPHRDQDMWRRTIPGTEYLLNVMWPLTPFTAENGATRLWAGTHRDLTLRRPRMGDATIAEMSPGDVLLYSGSVIHAAGFNASMAPRRGMVVGYALGWLKQCESMALTYPPQVARTFPPALADLLGYRAQVGNLGCVDGRCPSELLSGDWDAYAGAREVMTPAHREVLESFAVHQDWQ
jgi:ectoine hydroxylase-related dioxygenase (phytanoyl-CoA dioxygenase family)